jgi:MFS family permease
LSVAGRAFGFIFGPFIGGLLSDRGFLFPALFAAALSFVNFLGMLLWLPESYTPNNWRKRER